MEQQTIKMKIKPHFAGHETFVFRYSWLKKALDSVLENSNILSQDKAVEQLGVGKNMVKSIRYWSLATNILTFDKNSGNNAQHLKPTSLGKRLIGDDGFDPYLEQIGSLWLLHHSLVTNIERATAWFWMFNLNHQPFFSVDTLANNLLEYINNNDWKNIHISSIKKDITCILKMYNINKNNMKEFAEDEIDCPLAELNLIEEYIDKKTFRFKTVTYPRVPIEILCYSILSFVELRNKESNSITADEMLYEPFSPGMIFKMNKSDLMFDLENLVNKYGEYFAFDEFANVSQLFLKKPIRKENLLEDYYN